MNNKVKAGLKTLAVFVIAGVSSMITLLIVTNVSPIYLVFGCLTVGILMGAYTIYNYFLSMAEASDKINSLIDNMKNKIETTPR